MHVFRGDVIVSHLHHAVLISILHGFIHLRPYTYLVSLHIVFYVLSVSVVE